MKALAKSLMCVAMAACSAVAFTGCDNDSESSATTAPQTTNSTGASTQGLTLHLQLLMKYLLILHIILQN